MADYLRTKGIWLIVVLALTGRVAAAGAKAPAEGHAVQGADDQAAAPLVLQALDYTENPVDIPNPDRGFERGNDDAAGLGAFVPNTPGGSNYWGHMTIPPAPPLWSPLILAAQG